MSTYTGPDRRGNSGELMMMLARIDERTQSMKEKMDTLATCERVDAVEQSVNSRRIRGGTARQTVARAIQQARAELKKQRRFIETAARSGKRA